MHLLGHHLPDHKLVRIALTSFYGISHNTSSRILSRLQIHQETPVSSLTENQVTALSAYLSSPSTTIPPAPTPFFPPGSSKGKEKEVETSTAQDAADTLDNLKIETDLRRSMQADIAHHRSIGTYRGRRHAMQMPVRGQNTRNNAKTAKKMNRVDRRYYGTMSGPAERLALQEGSSSRVITSSPLMSLLQTLSPRRFFSTRNSA